MESLFTSTVKSVHRFACCLVVAATALVAALALAAGLACAGSPSAAWAATLAGLQSATPATTAAADYYAVLHEDGELVFQAQPSDEADVTNFAGSCKPYASGKAPWLAKAALIESVRFDESFAGIRPESLAFWFIGCKNLQAIDLQNLDASASTSMRSMFSGCSSLATIENLASFDTSSSTYFGSMFRDCASLTSIDVSHFDATHVGVLCFMFAGCTNLQELNMAGEGWRTSSLYLMVHVWENCKSLKSLDLSYLQTAGVHSMAKDFNGCSSLEYLNFSGADTTDVGTMTDMFNGCDKLSTVVLGPKFTFNGMASARQCSLPEGEWTSAATGIVYANVDVPNNTADTYTRVVEGVDPGSGSTTGPTTPDVVCGEFDVPNLQSSLGMFNHFVEGSGKLVLDEDKATLAFTTDGSISMVQNISKVAIGPSSKLTNPDDMLKDKFSNSLLGNPVIFEGTLVSAADKPAQYAFELEFARQEFEQMLASPGGIYLTLYHCGYNAWHRGTNDLLITLGEVDGYTAGGGTSGGQGPDTPEPTEPDGEVIDPNTIEDGTYSVELTVLPSMVKLAGHNGEAAEPRVVVSGDDAWLVVSYRSSLGSAWRYGQMAWGAYEDVVASGKNGFGGAPTFKEGKSAADGMSDATLDAMTFALPLSKSDLISWLASGDARVFTVSYVKGYSEEHDGDWWKPASEPQSTMTPANPRVASEAVAVPADYAAVLDALASVPKAEDLEGYTDESVAKLTEALARVNGSPKPTSAQAEVDAMAAAIANAVKALETKEAAAARVAAEKAAAEKAAAEKAAADKQKDASASQPQKTSIAKATVKVAKATYSGKSLKPKVTVKLGGKTLVLGTDYSVAYSNNKKAGKNAKVTVSGKGSYTGKIAKKFTIAKAKNTLSAKGKTITVKAKAKEAATFKAAKAFKVKKARGTVTYKKVSGSKKVTVSKAGKVTVKRGLKKGTYKVKVKVTAAGTKNYKRATKTVTLKVKVK